MSVNLEGKFLKEKDLTALHSILSDGVITGLRELIPKLGVEPVTYEQVESALHQLGQHEVASGLKDALYESKLSVIKMLWERVNELSHRIHSQVKYVYLSACNQRSKIFGLISAMRKFINP